MVNDIKNMPNKDRQKILKHLNESGRVVVVLQKNGRLRTYAVEKYISHVRLMRELIKGHKPWMKRQKSVLGPIGSQPLGIHSDLTRTSIYEGR